MRTIPRKRFGQNFLHDKNIINKIIAAIAPQKEEHFVEIGPGLGALTTALLPITGTLDAIEIDYSLIPKLTTACNPLGKLNIHQADVLEFDFTLLRKSAELAGALRIVGNLPYNISTPLIFHLLKQLPCIYDMHFMLQEEVVDRLVATPNSKIYGRLSVMVQYFCKVTKLFTVPPTAFYPKPKIYSAFIRLVPHQQILFPAHDVTKLEQIVKLAFNQRRKTIHNSLKTIITNEQLIKLNIDPILRPEQLTINDFVKISNIHA